MPTDVTLSDDEHRHLELLHRNGNDPNTSEMAEGILRKTNYVDEDGNIVFEHICNHDTKRDATTDEREQYGQSTSKPETVCEDCGTIWDYYGRVVVSGTRR